MCLSYFSHCCDQMTDKEPYKEERVCFSSSLKRGGSHHGRKGVVAGMGGNWSHHFHSEEANSGWEMGSGPQSVPARFHFLRVPAES